jgi:glucan 1,3-beta-glucosidase
MTRYFLKAIEWARKYGIRINLDLHAVPGSQNGWNHSGRLGETNFLRGAMGYANAQRTLDYIRIITEFISQPQYKDVVVMFGVLNEPRGSPVIGGTQLDGLYVLISFWPFREANSSLFSYKAVYDTVREVTGLGEGNGPVISFHEGFQGLTHYSGFMQNADRIALDNHPYICFGQQSSAAMSTYATTPCDDWGKMMNDSMVNFGLTGAGEFSNAVTDCGLWLNNVNEGTRYEGTYSSEGPWPSQGSCTEWTDWQNWDQTMKDGIEKFALASMDALQNWFFWTWKIGNSTRSGKIESPAWSYQLGLEQGWMPKDPRSASGVCGNTSPWTPPLKPWQTGGTGAGLNVQSDGLQWPPASITNGGLLASLPSYTPTGTIVTLPGPTFTQSSGSNVKIDAGSGWANPSDTVGMYVQIQGCSYLDPWIGPTATPPPVCAAGKKRAYPPPMITPRP